MASIEEQITEIENEISRTQKNKATEHHIGILYGKIAKLKALAEKKKSQGGATGGGYFIKKSGNATIALVGFPSVGKSTLINKLTNVKSEVAAYEFTTLYAIPGMMKYKDAQLQIIDLPGIIHDASKGKGRGSEVLGAARNADLIVIILDAKKTDKLSIIKQELFNAGIRLDKKPPKVLFKKTPKGGLNIQSTYELTKISPEIIESIMRNVGIVNAEIIIREDASAEDFMDALLGNRHYCQSLLAINKCDELNKKEADELKKKFPDAIFISAEKNKGLEKLREEIFEKTRIIRVYLKPKGKEADLNEPIIMHKGDTVYDLALKIHKDFIQYFKYSQVWGKSAKFPGQKLGLKHELKDKDIVTIAT
ncbi:MAG: GTP-binding protein [Candidatus Nanoarchaeia archaeon]|nr:GTP-binding protein [Candidatus Nanoarchaeia archaeon]MDD5054447.1 GTP-binding protein [Candidatus Nanoarchaeia archaeon]MDD5499414.1 GTP-binding protein [Candidatus Nanoarchaeia archaeon]